MQFRIPSSSWNLCRRVPRHRRRRDPSQLFPRLPGPVLRRLLRLRAQRSLRLRLWRTPPQRSHNPWDQRTGSFWRGPFPRSQSWRANWKNRIPKMKHQMQMTSRARPKTKMTRNPLSPLMDRKFLNWQRFRWHAQQLSTVFPCKPAGKNDPILYYIDMAHGIYIYMKNASPSCYIIKWWKNSLSIYHYIGSVMAFLYSSKKQLGYLGVQPVYQPIQEPITKSPL